MNPSNLEIRTHRHTPASPWTYAAADRFQKEWRDAIAAGKETRCLLLFSEFEPTITWGRRGAPPAQPNDGITQLRVDRGGLETYHGPGQWTVFVVGRLEWLTGGDTRGVRKFVEALLDAGARTARKMGLLEACAVHAGPRVGIWTNSRLVSKVGSVGISVQKRIVQHGLGLNVHPTPESFLGIQPCGIEGAKPGYLFESLNEREQFLRMEQVREVLQEELFLALLARRT